MATNIQLLSYKSKPLEDKFVYHPPTNHQENHPHDDYHDLEFSSDDEEEIHSTSSDPVASSSHSDSPATSYHQSSNQQEVEAVVDPQRPIIFSSRVKRLGQYYGEANESDSKKEAMKIISYLKSHQVKGRKSRVTIYQNCILIKLKHDNNSGMDKSSINSIQNLKAIYTFKELTLTVFLVFQTANSHTILPLKFIAQPLADTFFDKVQSLKQKNSL